MKTNKNKKTTVQKITTIKRLILLVTLLNVIGSILLSSLANKQKQVFIQNQQAIANLTERSQNKSELYKFLGINEEGIQQIHSALPNEDTIADFVSTIEDLLSLSEIEGDFHFSAIVPSKANNQLSIPFLIKMNTTIPKFLSFMRQLEKMPYIIQVTSVNINTPQGIGGGVEASIGATIYVQDPFES